MSHGSVFCWLLDVEPLWPVEFAGDAPFKSTEIWCRSTEVQKALANLSQDEQTKTLNFFRHTDAKLCLGSCLLKRHAISARCGIPWKDVLISKDANHKPCYVPTSTGNPSLEFNVSHHGSLVGIAGCQTPGVKLGIDIVKMNWERDYSKVLEEGFSAWAHTYDLVFSDREVADIADYRPLGIEDGPELVRARLRHFYAHWALKEAYVKMTSEALMASWLKDLEFRNVKVPARSESSEWGEICREMEIYFQGERLKSLHLRIQTFREDYMIAICASTDEILIQPCKVLDLVNIFPPA